VSGADAPLESVAARVAPASPDDVLAPFGSSEQPLDASSNTQTTDVAIDFCFISVSFA
jgi:hypothetical protein